MSKEAVVVEIQLLKTLVFYFMVVVLGGLFIACIVEGFRQQFMDNSSGATILYIVGLASLIAGVYVYKKGRLLITV